MKTTRSLNHYTYVINDLENGKSYIGVRSCKGLPVDDTAYMGSSAYLNEVIAQKDCKKDVDVAVYGRWHGNKCKMNKVTV